MLPITVEVHLLRRCKALLRDERGSYELIQFALILPILVGILYGSFEILKLISIKQSLDAGTYRAARYLSVYHQSYTHYFPPYSNRSADDRSQAERLIRESLLANPFISRDTPVRVITRYFNAIGQEIPAPVDFFCGDMRAALDRQDTNGLIFTVRTQVILPWEASVLGLPLGHVTLGSAHTAFVDCGPWYPRPRTPTPVAALTAVPGAGG
jgi:hypothetical protein